MKPVGRRLGTGWSDDVELPRSTDEVTGELHEFLHVLGVPAPRVLVGHSLGGAYAQRYAQRFPDAVAGLVLLDPLHEDWDLYMPPQLRFEGNTPADAQMPQLPPEVIDHLRGMLASSLAGFPETLRESLVAKHASPERLPTGFREGRNVISVMSDLRRGGPRPNVPITILSASGIDAQQLTFSNEAQLREQIQGSERLYASFAASTPRGQHRTIADASHVTLPMVRPDAVARAVTDLLDGQLKA